MRNLRFGFWVMLPFLLWSQLGLGQSYETLIEQHRTKYKQEFLEDERSPIQEKDFKFLNFYPANKNYLVSATFTAVNDSMGFDMHTHSGKNKKYVVYGKLDFQLKKSKYTLFVYQSIDLRQKEGLEDYLFIPFTDLTNGESTYGGGRYLDIRIGDIVNHQLTLDFNKAYNPYCAYKIGYSCPIPPPENHLDTAIEAGEKRYSLEPKE